MSEPTPSPSESSADRPESPKVAPSRRPVRTSQRAGWIAPLALVISLLAAAAAGWALLKPAPEGPHVTADPVVADPKARACSAFYLVSNGVALQSRTDIGPEPAAVQAVAANARLAMAGGAAYLRDNLASNTPAELADPLRKFADQLQTIAQYYLAGQSNDNPDQAARLTEADKTTKQLIELCK